MAATKRCVQSQFEGKAGPLIASFFSHRGNREPPSISKYSSLARTMYLGRHNKRNRESGPQIHTGGNLRARASLLQNGMLILVWRIWSEQSDKGMESRLFITSRCELYLAANGWWVLCAFVCVCSDARVHCILFSSTIFIVL